MNNQIERPDRDGPSWSDDLWGGLAAMLVALPSSVAFGILVYTTLGPESAGAGAMAGLIGAAVLGLVVPLVGKTPGLISAPCAPAAAVLGGLATDLLAGKHGPAIDPAAIAPLLIATVLFSSALQVLYGAIGGGRLIKFIPYPVVSGYLSGVGTLIALGQIPKLFGLPKGTPLVAGLVTPDIWKWQGLVVGLVTIVVMGAAPRMTKKIPGAILGLVAGMATYFVVAVFSPGMLQLKGNPLVIGSLAGSGSIFHELAGRATSLAGIDLGAVHLVLLPALALSILLSIDTLKTCVVLDVLTHGRHNSDRQLIGQGVGNLFVALLGGMPGAGTMGPTLVNVTSGGRSVRSGVFSGAFVVAAILLLGDAIAWVPIGALAGVLLVVAWRMFDKTMFRLLRHRSGHLDFTVIAAVILVAVFVDLIAASGVGVALAILLFVRDQIRGSVIRRKRYLNEMSSKTRRLAAERAALKQHGGQGVFCELQGSLFFGTTDQLFSQLESDLRTKRYLLLDMRRVQSMDYTAAHLLEQMQAQLAQRGGRLLFSGMPSGLLEQRDFERYLAQLGIVRKGSGVIVAETLDGALEWMEERIIEEAGVARPDEERPLDVNGIDLFHGFDASILDGLTACMRELSVPEGHMIFRQGDQADEVFFVRRGSVRILLPLEGGKHHHLATIGAGDFFGELSFLDRGIRSADAEAKQPTELYALSRSHFDTQIAAHSDFAVHVFARIASAIGERLRQTDIELRTLEER